MINFWPLALVSFLYTFAIGQETPCPEINSSRWRQNIHTYVTQMELLQRKKPGYPARLNTYDQCRPISEGLECQRSGNRIFWERKLQLFRRVLLFCCLCLVEQWILNEKFSCNSAKHWFKNCFGKGICIRRERDYKGMRCEITLYGHAFYRGHLTVNTVKPSSELTTNNINYYNNN